LRLRQDEKISKEQQSLGQQLGHFTVESSVNSQTTDRNGFLSIPLCQFLDKISPEILKKSLK